MSIWTDPTNSVPAIKSDSGAPTGASTEWASADANKIRQALLDISVLDPAPITATGSTTSRTLAARFAEVVNVKDFGATGDGVTDDYAAIQAALDEAGTGTLAGGNTSYKTVYFPPGTYSLSLPLRVRNGNCALLGDKRNTYLVPATQNSAVMLVAATTGTGANQFRPLGTGAALASGSGVSQAVSRLVSNNNITFDLRRSGLCELNGLSAFTAECFINFSAFALTYNVFLSSAGSLPGAGTGFPFNGGTCFYLSVQSDGSLKCGLSLGSSFYTATSSAGSITAGITYHVAMSYDGSTLRLFQDGVLVASTAATGTVTQRAWNHVLVGGGAVNAYGPGGWSWLAPEGNVDSVRISSIARYTSGFTKPTAKLTRDANTKCLINYDVFHDSGSCIGIWGPSGNPVYIPCTINQPDSFVVHAEISGFRVRYGTIWMVGAQQGIYENLDFYYGYGAIYAKGCYLSVFRDIDTLCNNTSIFLRSSAICKFSRINLQGGQIGIGVSASTADMDSVYFSPGSISETSLAVSDPTSLVNLSNCAFSVENGVTLDKFLSHVSIYGGTVNVNGQSYCANANVRQFASIWTGGLVLTDFGFGATNGTTTSWILDATGAYSYLTYAHFIRPRFSSDTQAAIPLTASTYGIISYDQPGIRVLGNISSPPTFNARYHSTFTMTLTASIASSTLSNLAEGQKITFIITQNGTGGWTFAWPSNVKGGGTVDPTASKTSCQSFVSDGTNAYAIGPIQTGM